MFTFAGFFCGQLQPFNIKSSGTDLFVQFFSDADRTAAGFHATFTFERDDAISPPIAPPVDGGVVTLGGVDGDKQSDDDVSKNDANGRDNDDDKTTDSGNS